MKLNVLLMCRTSRPCVFAAAFKGIQIAPEVCLSAPDAMELLVKGHIPPLVLDFDLPGAVRLPACAHDFF